MIGLLPLASFAEDVQRLIFDAAQIMLYPVLIALLVCLVWALVELGVFLYELVQRFRFRDTDALEISALRARKAFAAGKPRAAYRHLQENKQSITVTRFLFDLIRNYQTERLAAKPLKLLQDYEFYTVKRLERTRLLTRLGPVLGLMGALIPLAPALSGLARGEITALAENLEICFSVAVIGLLIGGLAFLIGLVRDRMYSQDISDLEYLMEILEGNVLRLQSGRRRDRTGTWETDPSVTFTDLPETATANPLVGAPYEVTVVSSPSGQSEGDDPRASKADRAAAAAQPPGASFDDPTMSWYADDDPFAALGPAVSERGPATPPSADSDNADRPSGTPPHGDA